jgi:hypothetical protein
MHAPLKLQAVVPIYALSGSPHPDTPPIAAGKAAAIEAENARSPPAGLRRRLPPAGGASVSRGQGETSTNSFRFPT